MLFVEYKYIGFYIFSLIIFLFILILINFLVIFKNNYTEKLAPYECGFQAFEYSISNFDIKYYLIAVLFLLFDLELIFFLPFLLTINYISIIGICVILLFFLLLIIGFMYEWKLKILNFNDIFQLELNKEFILYKK